jgi:hypothetical protein
MSLNTPPAFRSLRAKSLKAFARLSAGGERTECYLGVCYAGRR